MQCGVGGLGNRPSEGPGGGIKLANHWGSAISTGNTLAINTNSLLCRTPWPINASDAETGNSDELSLTPALSLMGQKGTQRASLCILLKKWLKWQLQWPDTYLIRAPCRHITLSYRQRTGKRGVGRRKPQASRNTKFLFCQKGIVQRFGNCTSSFVLKKLNMRVDTTSVHSARTETCSLQISSVCMKIQF